MQILQNYLQQINCNEIQAKLQKFSLYYEFLIKANESMNLTAITDLEQVQHKHFIDSLKPEKSLFGSIIDIGTGAGFPAIPLAIIREDCAFTLVDSLKKRTAFLQEVKKILELKNIEIIHSRAEDLDKSKKHDFALARAVAPLNILCEYCLPFIKKGAKMIAYKGSNYKEEIQDAKKALQVLGARVTSVQEYRLYVNDEAIQRSIIEITKERETPSIYPRIGNKARLKPLINE